MKKFLFVFVSFMVSIMMQAGDVSRQEALEKARRFMPDKEFKQPIDTRRKVSTDGPVSSPYYVFNAENKGGFVIVSGDDRTEAILGYADKGELDVENAPENVKWLLDYYDKVITALGNVSETNIKQVDTRRKVSVKADARQKIEPLLKTQWGQMDPYNKFCPEQVGTGLRYPAGCVPVAMAQIINYHQWPQGEINAVEEYISNGIQMPTLPSTSFDWDNMTEDEIARLMLYCGQAVKVEYTPSGSGAFESETALVKNFGYSKSLTGASRRGYSDEQWEVIVYEELLRECPVYYEGRGNGSHAFVVDGYADGKFHINWGWNGNLDGYYLLTGLTTEEDLIPYNEEQYAVLGIKPPMKIEDTTRPYIYVSGVFSSVNVTRKHLFDAFPSIFYYCTLTNEWPNMTTLDIGYGLFCDDELIQVLSQERHTFDVDASYTFNCHATISADIADGTYRIMAIYRKNDSEEWAIAMNSMCYHYKILVDNYSLSLVPVPDYSSQSIYPYEDFGIHDIDGITYRLSYQSYNYVAEVLPYQQNGKYSGDIFVPDEVDYLGLKFRVYQLSFDAFSDCKNLKSLSVRCNGRSSHLCSNCPQLTKIELREGYCFAEPLGGCPALEEIILPSTLSDVNRNFPIYCSNLKTIRFTGEVLTFREVPEWDESSLPLLEDVYFPMITPPAICSVNGIKYKGNVPPNSNARIHIPQGTLGFYQQSQWKEWIFVEDLPAYVPDAVTWGYLHGTSWCDENGFTHGGLGVITNETHDIEYAMRVPAEELTSYKDCTINRIEVFAPQIGWDYETQRRDYQYVFITKRGKDYITKKSFDVVRGKWNTIELSEPYTITGEELFVGFGRNWDVEGLSTDDSYQTDAFWVRAMGGKNDCLYVPGVWYNEGKNPNYGHPMALRFTIEGNNVPQGAVIRELAVAEGEGLNIQAVVRNRSLNIVQSYTVSWATDDEQTGTQTFETNLLPNTSETISIPLPTSLGTGHHAVTFDIHTLDGQENALKGLNPPTIHLYNGTEAIVISSGNYTREYGEENPVLYDINGLNPNGSPEVECDATRFSPVGEYPITLKAGTITNENVVFVNGGSLMVTKAPLTVAANNYAIKQGTTLPEFGFSCEGFKNGETETALKTMPTLTCTTASSNVLGTYDINIVGAEADNYEITHQKGVLQVSIPGNVTGSGNVTVQDATLTVNYIMGTNDDKGDDYKFAVADMNDDDEVDVFDVTGMIGAILSNEVSAKVRKVVGNQPPVAAEQLHAKGSVNGIMLNVDQSERFTSFQMDVDVPDGVTLTDARLMNSETGHTVRFAKVGGNRYRVLGISMKSVPLKAATDGLLELSLSDGSSAQVDNILFVTPRGTAVRYGAISYSDATGVESIVASQSEDEIYDLSGRKMNVPRDELPKGVYIINQQKVVIK